MNKASTDAFEQSRRFLLGLAYRILGSRSEAEDAVQDVFLKWHHIDASSIDEPRAWLTTACTRHCIDLLRSSDRMRVDYVGTWLPEPVHTRTDATPEQAVELASSLSTAFLLVLQRLAPKERAAYLLCDVFDRPFAEVAAILGVQEAACRKLVSRARDHVCRDQARFSIARERQVELLQAFHGALQTGVTSGLAAMLADEVALCADSGGKVPTLDRTLHGRPEVLAYVTQELRTYWAAYQWQLLEINGNWGVVLRDADHVAASMTLGFDASGRVCDIYIMRNPDKLTGLAGSQTFPA